MTSEKREFLIIGTGFVADLYMRSVELHDDAVIVGAYDRDADRLSAFGAFWEVPTFATIEDGFSALSEGGVVLNLTNPGSHYDISKAALEAGHHVYSEKPLAMTMADAEDLVAHATHKNLRLGSAPCSYLSEAAQTLAQAYRDNVAGDVKLVYAELDDGFITQAPYESWVSESGAPWPAEDEFRCGCTLEHAGYYLTWLVMMFGPVRSVTAASANLADKPVPKAESAPDTSIGILFFENGVVARITCSILAPHDHEIKLIGTKGNLELHDCWDNRAAVRFRKRLRVRRRLMESPMTRRIRPNGTPPPAPGRRGSASMNFFLGPMELANSIAEGRTGLVTSDMALHVNEITLALQNAGESAGAVQMTSTCSALPAADWTGDAS